MGLPSWIDGPRIPFSWGGPYLTFSSTKSCGRWRDRNAWKYIPRCGWGGGAGKVGGCSRGSAPAPCGFVRLRTILALFPASLMPLGPAERCSERACEHAEAWDPTNFAFCPCGFPFLGRGSVPGSPLQFRTPGDSSEMSFSPGRLFVLPSRHVWSGGRPERQQQPPSAPAQRAASSRQGAVVWIPGGSGSCGWWLPQRSYQLGFVWNMRMGCSGNLVFLSG